MSHNPTYDPEPGYDTDAYNMASYRQAVGMPPPNVSAEGNGKSYRYAIDPVPEDEYDGGEAENTETKDVKFSNGDKPAKASHKQPAKDDGGFWSKNKVYILIGIIILVSILWIIFLALYANELTKGTNVSPRGDTQPVVQEPEATSIKVPVTQTPESTTVMPETTTTGVQEDTIQAGGLTIKKYVLQNRNGMMVELIGLGARINRMVAPGGTDLVIGFDTSNNTFNFEDVKGQPFGSANGRICRPQSVPIQVDGSGYTPKGVTGSEFSDGGPNGLYTMNFEGTRTADGVKFTRTVTQDDDGLPGSVVIEIHYMLNDQNELTVTTAARPNGGTSSVIDLCSEMYFNMNPSASRLSSVGSHDVMINGYQYYQNNQWTVISGGIPDLATQPKTLSGVIQAYKGAFGNNVAEMEYGYRLKGASGLRYAASIKNGGTEVKIYTSHSAARFSVQLSGTNSVQGRDGAYGAESFIKFATHSVYGSGFNSVYTENYLDSSSTYSSEVKYSVSV